MPGYQEILIISAILLAVFFLPRMLEPKKPTLRLVQPKRTLSGRRRMAVALSVAYPLAVAAVMQPWRNDLFNFLFVGLGPVLLGWLLFWVLDGFRHR